MTAITQLNTAGQVTIPVAIRKQLGISAGDHVQITIEEHHIVVEPVVVAPKAPRSSVVDAAEAWTERHQSAMDRLAEM